MQDHPRLSEALDKYMALRHARFAPATVKNEEFVLRRFLLWYGEDIQVRHLKATRVQDWFYGPDSIRSIHTTRDGVERPPVQDSTHNFYRSRLKSFFEFCKVSGWLRSDPLIHVGHIMTATKKRLQPPPHVLLAMLDSAHSARDRCYLATAANTALRASEINRLRVSDVDLEAERLRVWISKTKEEDLMPISSDLDAELRIWMIKYAEDIGRPLRGEDHLFPARKGSRYVWRKNAEGVQERGRTEPSWLPGTPITKVQKIVQEALAAVGLPTKHEGVHTLRRAVARAYFDRLAVQGYDSALRQTMSLLHHKSSATTEHYLGLSSEREQRDKSLAGKPFLTAMISDDNVRPLRRKA